MGTSVTYLSFMDVSLQFTPSFKFVADFMILCAAFGTNTKGYTKIARTKKIGISRIVGQDIISLVRLSLFRTEKKSPKFGNCGTMTSGAQRKL